MASINDVLEACVALDERLTQCNKEEMARMVQQHITNIDEKLKFKVPDFSKDLEWLNVSQSLSWEEYLRGKIVVLDFFTYCCINCLHVLPDLEALESIYSVQDGVVVVGVHSAKFQNEKLSENILSALIRYNIRHPVVNDHDIKMWTELQIACWPTFVIVGPSQQFLYTLVGEGHRERLFDFLKIALEYYKEKGDISDHSLPVKPEIENLSPSPLYFPGKICTSSDGKTIVVADTGHNRILQLDKNGIVMECIGGPDRGYIDGGYTECRFNSPQGLVFDGEVLYVADTENHAIRKVDLRTRHVSTLVGTGRQGQDKEGGKTGTLQEISSPWDLALGGAPDGQTNCVLYLAMAGSHQIWVYFLKNVTWYKNIEYKAGTCVRFAGTGNEENRNNSYPEKAAFAQPSGLAISAHPAIQALYVADSESSSIRVISLKDGSVKGLAGGDINPINLFAYGDEDGVGVKAKFQHPLAVTLVTTESGPLLVADSYNHKIKSIDLKTKNCTTIMGTGQAGSAMKDNPLKTELNEPGGLCVSNNLLYIADTNNHNIKVLDLIIQKVSSLPVIFAKQKDNESQSADTSDSALKETGGQFIPVQMTLKMSDSVHLTEDAPSSWELRCQDEGVLPENGIKGKVSGEKCQTLTNIEVSSLMTTKPTVLSLKCRLFICDDRNLCRMHEECITKEIGPTLMPTDPLSFVFTVNVN
ncbi:hypothetical protein ACJMK2_005293 [Sinanodonta woodiana]|uniref:Thioredoxin domain-containing protein n=1 Tax=Sinanodonta woodiana TaxID=1069815 RepID=A0ABD3VSQ2_SINWO